jgi:hypothetical protein
MNKLIYFFFILLVLVLDCWAFLGILPYSLVAVGGMVKLLSSKLLFFFALIVLCLSLLASLFTLLILFSLSSKFQYANMESFFMDLSGPIAGVPFFHRPYYNVDKSRRREMWAQYLSQCGRAFYLVMALFRGIRRCSMIMWVAFLLIALFEAFTMVIIVNIFFFFIILYYLFVPLVCLLEYTVWLIGKRPVSFWSLWRSKRPYLSILIIWMICHSMYQCILLRRLIFGFELRKWAFCGGSGRMVSFFLFLFLKIRGNTLFWAYEDSELIRVRSLVFLDLVEMCEGRSRVSYAVFRLYLGIIVLYIKKLVGVEREIDAKLLPGSTNTLSYLKVLVRTDFIILVDRVMSGITFFCKYRTRLVDAFGRLSRLIRILVKLLFFFLFLLCLFFLLVAWFNYYFSKPRDVTWIILLISLFLDGL